MTMRVLTFGWDYPPKRNGGLGVACFGLTRELVTLDTNILFVLPKSQPTTGAGHFIFADTEEHIDIHTVPSSLQPYQSTSAMTHWYNAHGVKVQTGRTLLEEIFRYATAARGIAQKETFDIIHAHDWTAYMAGVAAKQVSGKPLILHVHATSFDQAASAHVDPVQYAIEQAAFSAADCVVAVSNLTRQLIIEKYDVNPDKVEVVHNGADTFTPELHQPTMQELKNKGTKIVLYHGRITIQKGVDYFVTAAKRVLEVEPNVVFVISGWGDLEQQIMHQVAAAGLSGKVLFAGALWEEERDRMYQSADLLVMPSVSEPFGLVPLEALQHGTPSLISKQSGVGEVMAHVLKVDFWDVDEMANQIVAALRYPALNRQLVTQGRFQLPLLAWRHAAIKLREMYERLVHLGGKEVWSE